MADDYMMKIAEKYAWAVGSLQSSLRFTAGALELIVKNEPHNVVAKSALKSAKETLEEVEENLKW